LAVFIDLLALRIPYSFFHWIVVGGAPRQGPPGGALVFFAILEFVLLRIVRRSPGYWLLGITAPVTGKPQVDPAWTARESPATLAVGVALCAIGVLALTSWPAYHVGVPYFGIPFPVWLSVALTLPGCVGLILAGAAVLRLDLRGVWLGGGLSLLLLLAGVGGLLRWSRVVEATLPTWRAYASRPVGQALLEFTGSVPILVPIVPLALLVGLFLTWKRLESRGRVIDSSSRKAAR
jgi:hypothetical protein